LDVVQKRPAKGGKETYYRGGGTGSAVSLALLDGSEDLGGDVVDLVQHVLVCHLLAKRDLLQEEKRPIAGGKETCCRG
jgi:hypothetical protein